MCPSLQCYSTTGLQCYSTAVRVCPCARAQHENVKKALLLQGTKSSAVLKEVLSDVHHLKRWGGNSMKLSRKNENVRPFEAGGEASLEFLAQKADCSLFMVCPWHTLATVHSCYREDAAVGQALTHAHAYVYQETEVSLLGHAHAQPLVLLATPAMWCSMRRTRRSGRTTWSSAACLTFTCTIWWRWGWRG